MKNIKYLFIAICVVFIAACSQDKGNYDYIKINDIVFKSLNESNSFERLIGDSLNIKANFSRSIDSTATSDLSYVWMIEEDTISTERDLKYLIPSSVKSGNNTCRYFVTSDNGMTYGMEFELIVRNSFSFGYYILCENEDQSGELFYLASRVEPEEGQEPAKEFFRNTKTIGHLPIGSSPSKLNAKFGHISSLGGYYHTISVICKGGSYPIIITNNGDFSPTQTIAASSFADGIERPFSPENMGISPYGHSYFLSNGSIIRQVERFLYEPADYDGLYYWESMTVRANEALVVDRDTKMPYIVQSEKTEAGATVNAYLWEDVIEIPELPADMPERKIIYSALDGSRDIDVVSVIGDKVELGYVDFDAQWKLNKYIISDNGDLLLPEQSDNVLCTTVGTAKDWYFIVGNSVYFTPNIAPRFTKFVDLPTDLGKPVEMGVSTEKDHFVITYYNEATKKGSLVRVWTQTKEINTFKDAFTKPISLGCYDGSPWW